MAWFASSVNLGQVMGGLMGGYLGHQLGPKAAIVIACVPGFLGWILISTTPFVALFILGRVLAGVSASLMAANVPLLVAQYSSNVRRGIFLSSYNLMISIGITFVYVLGSILHWRIVAAVPAGMTAILAMALTFLPESPIWLLEHKAKTEAYRAVKWLKCVEDLDKVINDLEKTIEKQDDIIGVWTALKNLRRPDIFRPVGLIIINYILVTFCGPLAIV